MGDLRWNFLLSVSPKEPYFIPSPNAKNEDDGVVLVSIIKLWKENTLIVSRINVWHINRMLW